MTEAQRIVYSYGGERARVRIRTVPQPHPYCYRTVTAAYRNTVTVVNVCVSATILYPYCYRTVAVYGDSVYALLLKEK